MSRLLYFAYGSNTSNNPPSILALIAERDKQGLVSYTHNR